MSILSHIVLPRVVLRRFEPVKGEPFHWIDCNSAPKYYIRHSPAKSFNIQEDYYDAETEEYLSKNVENRINSLLEQVPDPNDDKIELDENFRDASFLYLEALFSRDPTFHMEREETPSKIVMTITPKLKEARTIRNMYENVSYLINRSKVPFTLPSNGIIQIKNDIITPLSPRVALYFYNSTDKCYKVVDEDDSVMKINRIAFRQAIAHNCSALICSEKSVLNKLKEDYLSSTQQI